MRQNGSLKVYLKILGNNKLLMTNNKSCENLFITIDQGNFLSSKTWILIYVFSVKDPWLISKDTCWNFENEILE